MKTNTELILAALENGKKLNFFNVEQDDCLGPGVYNLRNRISELKRKGHQIYTEMVKRKNRHGHEVLIAEYSMPHAVKAAEAKLQQQATIAQQARQQLANTLFDASAFDKATPQVFNH
jgi:hypothetical protein